MNVQVIINGEAKPCGQIYCNEEIKKIFETLGNETLENETLGADIGDVEKMSRNFVKKSRN